MSRLLIRLDRRHDRVAMCCEWYRRVVSAVMYTSERGKQINNNRSCRQTGAIEREDGWRETRLGDQMEKRERRE